MSWQGPRSRQTATQRGYDAEHRRERARRLPLFTATDPCGHCGRPLGTDTSRWHLPHNEARTGYEPGFWCAPCNVKDGARRGRARQNTTTMRW